MGQYVLRFHLMKTAQIIKEFELFDKQLFTFHDEILKE